MKWFAEHHCFEPISRHRAFRRPSILCDAGARPTSSLLCASGAQTPFQTDQNKTIEHAVVQRLPATHFGAFAPFLRQKLADRRKRVHVLADHAASRTPLRRRPGRGTAPCRAGCSCGSSNRMPGRFRAPVRNRFSFPPLRSAPCGRMGWMRKPDQFHHLFCRFSI